MLPFKFPSISNSSTIIEYNYVTTRANGSVLYRESNSLKNIDRQNTVTATFSNTRDTRSATVKVREYLSPDVHDGLATGKDPGYAERSFSFSVPRTVTQSSMHMHGATFLSGIVGADHTVAAGSNTAGIISSIFRNFASSTI